MTIDAMTRIRGALFGEGATLPQHLLNEFANELNDSGDVSPRAFYRKLDHYLGLAEDEAKRALLPRRELLDTADGDTCIEGSAFCFVQLSDGDKGFYLGIDTDSWTRQLYFDPTIEVEGFYCFDHNKLALVPEAEPLVAALKDWHDTGSVPSTRRLLDVWDNDLATRLFLEERDA